MFNRASVLPTYGPHRPNIVGTPHRNHA
jgi:hypothetical protein